MFELDLQELPSNHPFGFSPTLRRVRKATRMAIMRASLIKLSSHPRIAQILAAMALSTVDSGSADCLDAGWLVSSVSPVAVEDGWAVSEQTAQNRSGQNSSRRSCHRANELQRAGDGGRGAYGLIKSRRSLEPAPRALIGPLSNGLRWWWWWWWWWW